MCGDNERKQEWDALPYQQYNDTSTKVGGVIGVLGGPISGEQIACKDVTVDLLRLIIDHSTR